MNLGGSDYVKVWTPWRERFLWFPTRILVKKGTYSVRDKDGNLDFQDFFPKHEWFWLRTVYYRTSSYSNVDDSDIDYVPAIVETEYALNVFDILRKTD